MSPEKKRAFKTKLPELKKPKEMLVIFGDQLTIGTSSFESINKDETLILMMEVKEESIEPLSHVQRTVFFLSAMRHFARDLADEGYHVRYITLDDKNNRGGFEEEIKRAINTHHPEFVSATRPGDWRVLEKLKTACDETGKELKLYKDTHFLCSTEEFGEWAKGRKSLVMEYFYREMRQKYNILMDEKKKPLKGQWNFDKENREKYSNNIPDPPPPFRIDSDEITREVISLVKKQLPDLPGSVDDFAWPVTADDAEKALSHFIRYRLENFGPWQDVMVAEEPWLFHSHISPLLNTKLLNPRRCIEKGEEAYMRGSAPINSVEGFIRQILGWREFIRGVYWHEGKGYRKRNGLKEKGKLPGFYWDGETDMACIHHSIGQVVEHSYGHHIQRLMVTGNFALVSGINPETISDWYLGMYIDGIDWVTLPNTLGMVMHADGGVVGTKPYSASGAYIDRMSNYCKDCPYSPKEKTGEKACPFTVFFWDFLIRHQEAFEDNHRMGMMYRNVERLDKETKQAITSRAKEYKKAFGVT